MSPPAALALALLAQLCLLLPSPGVAEAHPHREAARQCAPGPGEPTAHPSRLPSGGPGFATGASAHCGIESDDGGSNSEFESGEAGRSTRADRRPPRRPFGPDCGREGGVGAGAGLGWLGSAHPAYGHPQSVMRSETGLMPGVALPPALPAAGGGKEAAEGGDGERSRAHGRQGGGIYLHKAPPVAGSHRGHLALYVGVVAAPLLLGLLVFGLVEGRQFPWIGFALGMGRRGAEVTVESPVPRTRSMTNWMSLMSALGGEEKEMIEMMPAEAYDDCQDRGTTRSCIICLSDLNTGDLMRIIPCCQHQFHASCLDPWLEESATCPLCRRHVESEEDPVQKDSERGTAARRAGWQG